MSTNNLLSPLHFTFSLDKAPELQYKTQRVSLPSITLDMAEVPTPFTTIHYSGTIEYGELAVTFLVDEDMDNYLEIVNWMNQLGHPESLTALARPIEHDAIVTIMSSAKRPRMKVKFYDIQPTSITPLELDSTLTDVPYVPATVTFKCLRYDFTLL